MLLELDKNNTLQIYRDFGQEFPLTHINIPREGTALFHVTYIFVYAFFLIVSSSISTFYTSSHCACKCVYVCVCVCIVFPIVYILISKPFM